jgi:hypothetical protein
MRERIAQRKRELSEKKAAQEQADLERYTKEQEEEGKISFIRRNKTKTKNFILYIQY